MFTIPGFTSPFDYVGVFLLVLGILLILGGVQILTLEKLNIPAGKRTWMVGIFCIVFGISFLLIEPTIRSRPVPTPGPLAATKTPDFVPVSSNVYSLIPLEGDRSTIFDSEDIEKNLSLRDPQMIEGAELSLLDSTGQVDLDGPQLWYVFEAEFVAAYSLLDDNGQRSQSYPEAMGLATNPEAVITIPHRDATIHEGKYSAMVLFADQNNLTFVYTRKDSVEEGYTVYFMGIEVDPNLLDLYKASQGDQLPGLEMDQAVGTAKAHEIIVAIRHNGVFKDVRLKRDWWQGF